MSDDFDERLGNLLMGGPGKFKFEAKPKIVRVGQPVTLSWSADRRSLGAFWSGDHHEPPQVTIKDGSGEVIFEGPPKGSHTVFPQQTTWYTLIADSLDMHEEKVAKVEVRPSIRR